jgi:hypothetical protein
MKRNRLFAAILMVGTLMPALAFATPLISRGSAVKLVKQAVANKWGQRGKLRVSLFDVPPVTPGERSFLATGDRTHPNTPGAFFAAAGEINMVKGPGAPQGLNRITDLHMNLTVTPPPSH